MSKVLDIAVVGSGISGLAAAWLLARRHKVTLYEQLARAGGHCNTVAVAAPEGDVPIDTGFIVYNTACYPNLIALLDHLGVATARTRMSFAVSLGDGAYEYEGSARGLLGEPANLLRGRHWRMVADILRFFRAAEADAASGKLGCMTFREYLNFRAFGAGFIEDHILPIGAAIWSTPAADMLAFPAESFIRFFANHGLLRLRNRPQWRTVCGGSRQYVRGMLPAIGEVRLGEGVRRIVRTGDGIGLETLGGERRRFDDVIIATHADQALALLGDADADEATVLSSFRYARNEAVLHSDRSLMPRRRRLWASWNYVSGAANDGVCVSYWMNSLQPLATRRDYFVTLNPVRPPAQDTVVESFAYEHPMFDERALAAQLAIARIQGRRRTWFAGSWCGSGFHEDALQAGLWAAEASGGVRRPWTVAQENGRLPWAQAPLRQAAREPAS